MSHWRLHPQLPVFAVGEGQRVAIYVPGRVMPGTRRLVEALAAYWADGEGNAPAGAGKLAAAAGEAVAAWGERQARAYRPVCLNVQLPYACDLACGYCYTRGQSGGALNRPAVAAAARLVAANCAEEGAALQLDVQGLGEPSGRWEDLQWVVAITQEAAAEAGVAWSGHVSTNGQLEPERARWLAANFGHVTLSCDGPPEIQDAVRPRRDGGQSSEWLERSAALLREGTAELEARATLTAANVGRLEEVVRYVGETLGIGALRVEPAFAQPVMESELPPPEELAARCVAAGEAGAARGVTVSPGSPRLLELHGTYCEAARDVLRLTPEGVAVNCLHGEGGGRARACRLGGYNEARDVYVLDAEAAAAARARCGIVAEGCRDCLNQYHCTGWCPDGCPEDGPAESDRCRFQRALAEAWVSRAAGLEEGLRADLEAVRREVAALPVGVDRAAIERQARRALRRYTLAGHEMPAPAWADEERCERGESAREALLQEARGRRGPLAVYVHVPFCTRRCVFCDCHSVVAGRQREEAYAKYVQRLGEDLAGWCAQGGMGGREVSTVHLGGGTPDAIGWELMGELVARLREGLGTGAGTEWALETTAAGAALERVERLRGLGFGRLHVGVQTLDDDLRRRLGRQTPGAEVLRRLEEAMAAGMVTSVDLLYGLPGQTAEGLLGDVARLGEIGIHGMSLYRLNLSSRNRGLSRRFEGFAQNPARELVMLQAAEARLLESGYRKNHYVHYALAQDRDAYFRHRLRGEDLLALGAWAAGLVGSLEYVCEGYPRYLESAWPGVEMVARHRVSEEVVEATARLMAGELPAEGVGELGAQWLEAGLVARDGAGHRLSATGSWWIAAMLEEL